MTISGKSLIKLQNQNILSIFKMNRTLRKFLIPMIYSLLRSVSSFKIYREFEERPTSPPSLTLRKCVCGIGAAISPGRGGGCHIRAIRRRSIDHCILFGLRIQDRVSFFESDSKTGRQICTITPSQGVLFGTLTLVLTYLSFSQREPVACNNG